MPQLFGQLAARRILKRNRPRHSCRRWCARFCLSVCARRSDWCSRSSAARASCVPRSNGAIKGRESLSVARLSSFVRRSSRACSSVNVSSRSTDRLYQRCPVAPQRGPGFCRIILHPRKCASYACTERRNTGSTGCHNTGEPRVSGRLKHSTPNGGGD
jgi:hypothetical protein